MAWPVRAVSLDQTPGAMSLEAYPDAVTAFQQVDGAEVVQGSVLVTLNTGQGTGGDRVVFRAGDRAAAAATVIDHGDGNYSQRLWVGEVTGPMEIEAPINDETVPMTTTVDVVEEFGGALDTALTKLFPDSAFRLGEGSEGSISLALVLFDGFGNPVTQQLGYGEQEVALTPSRGSVSDVGWDFD